VQIGENSRRGLHSKFAHDVRVGQESIRQCYCGHQIAVVLLPLELMGFVFVLVLVPVVYQATVAVIGIVVRGGAQIPVARSPGLEKSFVRWTLILLDS
jgi:hypothetical protein